MKVLIACEESQTVCKAFREKGHEAYSCDIQECSGGYPEWHIRDDVLKILSDKWDLIIAHPPCTYLTVTGNRWFNEEKYGDEARKRLLNRSEAIKFFMAFSKLPRVAIENPVGVMSTIWRKPDQIIHPWMFGDEASKATCLWLNGLPKLIPTNIVSKGETVTYESGKKMQKWYADAFKLPPKERQKLRSKTFKGIADAMADQFSRFIESGHTIEEWNNVSRK